MSKDKKPFPLEASREGAASLLKPNWHPSCTNFKNVRVDDVSQMIWGLPGLCFQARFLLSQGRIQTEVDRFAGIRLGVGGWGFVDPWVV